MKAFKFKVYQSKKNRRLHRRISLAGMVYNHCIALHKRYYRIYKKYPSYVRMAAHFKKKYNWFASLGSQAIQDILKRIDDGYQRFFKKLAKRPPTFKKSKLYKSFTLKYATSKGVIVPVGYKLLENNKIRIGTNIYKYHKSRDIEGNIKSLIVKRDTLGDLYLVFITDLEDRLEQTATGKTEGFDFGLKQFLVSSDSTEIESPLFFEQSAKKVAKASQELSRKKKGSNNRNKAKLNLARIHRKITNQRRDFHFKLAKKLATEHDAIYFEDLNLKGMVKLWGKKISDLAFAEFLGIQEYMSEKYGCVFGKIDKWFPSTKSCSVCWSINENLDLKTREWTCDCGEHHQRDHNAAKVIKIVGTSTIGVASIRQVLPATSVDTRIPDYSIAA